MKEIVFWIGAVLLVIGVILFGYGYMTIENIKTAAGSPLGLPIYFNMYKDEKMKWDLATLAQPVGVGISVLGAIMLAYGFLKK